VVNRKRPPLFELDPKSLSDFSSTLHTPQDMAAEKDIDRFTNVHALASECDADWPMYSTCAENTINNEKIIREVLDSRLLGVDTSFVLCGSFARNEMLPGSDCDWTLLVDGGVNTKHTQIALDIQNGIKSGKGKGLVPPGSSGVFGNMTFSHNLVHRIGGVVDTNENLTRRLLMLLESNPISLSTADSSETVWESVVRNILNRYFEEDVHFSSEKERKVPRFLFNDLTRYWRTICVDYAAKHWDQGDAKWALRNAKLRFSRKLLYASGIAFCYACQLDPPEKTEITLFGEEKDNSPKPYIDLAIEFARTTPLEYLAAFINAFVEEEEPRKEISGKIFGSYNEWLAILSDENHRDRLTKLSHNDAANDELFNGHIRNLSREFASGLKLLFFGRESEPENKIADLSLEYVGF